MARPTQKPGKHERELEQLRKQLMTEAVDLDAAGMNSWGGDPVHDRDLPTTRPDTPLLDSLGDLDALSDQHPRAGQTGRGATSRFTVFGRGNWGHFGAGWSGRLTVALHHVFNTPHDRIVWDVGHQTYPHKILTGRASA